MIMVEIFKYTYHRQTNEQSKVIQEVVSTETSKSIYAVMNKKQGDQMQITPEKRLDRMKKMNSSHLLSIHHLFQ